MVSLIPVMAPGSVSFSLLINYNEYNETQDLLEVKSPTIWELLGSNQFMSYPQQLCHSFKSYALPTTILLNYDW